MAIDVVFLCQFIHILVGQKAELKKLGWRVYTVWECELKKSIRNKTLLKLYNKICNEI